LSKKRNSKNLRKRLGSFWQSYFLINFKNELGFWNFYTNAFLGVLLLAELILALIYAIILITGYQLKSMFIPNLIVFVDCFLMIARLIRQIIEKLFYKD
jgi:hypothetical protein